MNIGDRVVFTAAWSTFYTMHGTVTSTQPHIMVLIDGDSYSIRVGSREIAPFRVLGLAADQVAE